MTGSTYAPQRWVDVETSKIQPEIIGVSGTASFASTTNIDTKINDDCLIRGIVFLCKNQIFNDTVTISIIDKDGVYFPVNTVVSTPVTNWNLNADQQLQAEYDSITPQKILGGLYIRITYVSSGLVNVTLGCNLLLNKVLV